MNRNAIRVLLICTPISTFIATAFAALLMTATVSARASGNATEVDCFPMCEAEKPTVVAGPTGSPKSIESLTTETPCGIEDQNRGIVGKMEDLNDRVKPIKEIVGYVRSPQGLAIKLVNDHVVKIPAWVGYVADPVGSLKSRAMDEVRTRAKDAVGLNDKANDKANKRAVACPAVDLQPDYPLDPNLIPIDNELTI
jgi:hypothetical protein